MKSVLPLDRRSVMSGGALLAASLTIMGTAWSIPAPVSSGGGDQGDAPWVYWYWMDANITAVGIRADLAAMHSAGIAGAIIFNIKGVNEATIVDPPVESQSPEWWNMIRLAAAVADGFAMKLAMNMCDGWGTAGGAWVTPERSAQILTASERIVGPLQLVGRLERPSTNLDDYRDIATFAFPAPEHWSATSLAAQISTSWAITDPEKLLDREQSANVIEIDEAGWILYSFEAPFTLRSIVVRARKRDLEAELAVAKEPPPTLHPSMAHHYREQLDNLTLALSAGDECNRLKATEIIRSLIERIVLTPEGSDLVVDVQGDLAGILTIAAQRTKPARKAGSAKASKSADILQFAMVAGVGYFFQSIHLIS